MLFELLPHLSRLVPLAERFFASHNAEEKAKQAAFALMAGKVTSDLNRLGEGHIGLEQALRDQNEQVAALAVETMRVRNSVESMDARFAKLEARSIELEAELKAKLKPMAQMMVVILVLLAIVFVLLLVLFFRSSHG